MIPLVEMVGVEKRFGPVEVGGRGRCALTGVSLRINRGDLIVLGGGYGSGKTTLLRSIAGLLRPDEGSITRYTPHALYVEAAAQPYAFLTAREILELYSSGEEELNRARQLFSSLSDEVAERTQVAELGDAGRAALALARAIARAPELLLVDGVLDALSPRCARRALARLSSLCAYTRGVVVATRVPWRFAGLRGSMVQLTSGRLVRCADQRVPSRRARTSIGAPAGASRPPSGAGSLSISGRSRELLLKPWPS
jgi:ABC-type multidrug transport system ATPase subunit